jgi:RNA polymerase sigma-70 factor (ECF subfamily)
MVRTGSFGDADASFLHRRTFVPQSAVNEFCGLAVYNWDRPNLITTDWSVDETYEKHIRPAEPILIRAAWRVLRSEQEAGDALQDALTRIWKHRWQLESHANPVAWMTRIVVNAAYDRLRLRKARRAEPLHADVESSTPTADLIAERQEMHMSLLQEIARLSPKQAQALLLRLVEELPYKSIAEALGCSEATARVHVQRGRERLRDRLGDLDPYTRSR